MRALMVVVLTAACDPPAKHKPAEAGLEEGMSSNWRPLKPPVVARDAGDVGLEDAATAVIFTPPAAVSAALAKETVKNFVVVDARGSLYPSAEAARKHEEATYFVSTDEDQPSKGEVLSLRVIADRGDVIELTTAKPAKGKPAADCGKPFKPEYELTVFVRRDQLLMRSTVAQSAQYADGTLVVIDVGAAVTMTEHGLAWYSPTFAATKLTPREDELAYSGPAKPVATRLPALPGVALYCDGDGAKTLAELGPKRAFAIAWST